MIEQPRAKLFASPRIALKPSKVPLVETLYIAKNDSVLRLTISSRGRAVIMKASSDTFPHELRDKKIMCISMRRKCHEMNQALSPTYILRRSLPQIASLR
ncbi:hypothetical protein Y887_17760 [Xanthomonas pisi DSM 18956]|uniref:Uncharacterized protein n=1 Tax=Xanthomonas pisi TaxID=56457 RepID=A0A2S7D614_9XANT|nr:hypothetical protein Y887_17760 [Xanthomonas pisi DSM 18956]PPU69174.1 hypothetical protein XpiCFBP4643_06505 [Xanthomonas pisi]